MVVALLAPCVTLWRVVRVPDAGGEVLTSGRTCEDIQLHIYIRVTERPVAWLGSTLVDVRAFPKPARERLGYALDRVQRGLEPPDWKPMPAIGAGVRELRVQVGRQFRVIYLARYAEAVYVLHAFEKRTRKTSRGDIALAKRRLAMVRRGVSEEDR